MLVDGIGTWMRIYEKASKFKMLPVWKQSRSTGRKYLVPVGNLMHKSQIEKKNGIEARSCKVIQS